jgi:hypothetical protein
MDICKLEDLSGLEIWAPASLFIHLETICARAAPLLHMTSRGATTTPTPSTLPPAGALPKFIVVGVRGKGRGLEGMRKIVRGLDRQNRIIVGRKECLERTVLKNKDKEQKRWTRIKITNGTGKNNKKK